MAKKSKAKSSRPKRAADGLYHVQPYIGRREDGSKVYKRFKGKDWDDLQVEIITYKKEWAAGLHREVEETQQQKEPTLIDAIEKYIETCRVMMTHDPKAYSPATIAGYTSCCNSISRHPAFESIAKAPISTITVPALQDAFNALAKAAPGEKKLSPKTIQNWFGVIKPAIDMYGPDIRLDKVRLAKNPSKKPIIFHESDIPQMLRIAREIDEDFYLYTLFITVLGLRQSESYALTWGDISAEPMISIDGGKRTLYGSVCVDKACVRDELGVYRVKNTKTEAGERCLSRPWSFFEQLYAVRPRGKDSERILRLKPNYLPSRWAKLKERIALPENMVMYDLRHYHATVMNYLRVGDDYIIHDMGHSNISITRKHYIEELDVHRQEINARVYQHTDNLLAQIN